MESIIDKIDNPTEENEAFEEEGEEDKDHEVQADAAKKEEDVTQLEEAVKELKIETVSVKQRDLMLSRLRRFLIIKSFLEGGIWEGRVWEDSRNWSG